MKARDIWKRQSASLFNEEQWPELHLQCLLRQIIRADVEGSCVCLVFAGPFVEGEADGEGSVGDKAWGGSLDSDFFLRVMIATGSAVR